MSDRGYESERRLMVWMERVLRNTSTDFSYEGECLDQLVRYYMANTDPYEASSAIQEGRKITPESYQWRFEWRIV